MRTVVGLAGRRGSGKTTLASALATNLGYARVSFGDYVRAEARRRGVVVETPRLEALGRELIQELGWDEFCRRVLSGTESAQRVVIDGIRHLAARDAIGRIVAPAHWLLAFVQIDDTERLRRISLRGRAGDAPVDTEMSDDIARLQDEADFVVSGADADAAMKLHSSIEGRYRAR